MATIEEMIKSSKCFGVAYDPSVKECKICEVYLKCKTKCEMGIVSKPADVETAVDKDEISMTDEALDKSTKKDVEAQATEPTAKPAKKKKEKAPKEEKSYSPDMPDISAMRLDELEKLVVERGGNVEDYAKYDNENIKKMRIKMFIKKTYEI